MGKLRSRRLPLLKLKAKRWEKLELGLLIRSGLMGKLVLLSLIGLTGCALIPAKTLTTGPIDLVHKPETSKDAINTQLTSGVCKSWKSIDYILPGDSDKTVEAIMNNNADRLAFGCKDG